MLTLALSVLLLVAATAHAGARSDVAKRLNRGLAGTPLAGLGWTFEAEGFKWNVNPFLVASISGTESSFGAAACGYNPFGIDSCRGRSFASWTDAIRFTTRLLRRFYIDLGYDTLLEIGGRYAACGACWANHNIRFLRGTFGQTWLGVTYPR